jgi:NAD(P)-dependent dehydrogenase (short-subunit alcohol dehydrogenase family)
MADMNGQVALVTGGIRGIGLAICERLMNRGVRVIGEVLDRHGQLDILVNNAGITVDKTVRKMTWRHGSAGCGYGAARCCRRRCYPAVPDLARQVTTGGSVHKPVHAFHRDHRMPVTECYRHRPISAYPGPVA